MFNPEYELQLHVAQLSDRGQLRQNNEDSVLVVGDDKYVIAIIADGMGGAVAGEEASRLAIESIRGELLTETYPQPAAYQHMNTGDLSEVLSECVSDANQHIYQRALDKPELKGMGTTLTMAFIRENGVVLAHVGDSRAYLVDEHEGIMCLTTDHSFVQALLDAGHISPEEAEYHPMKNVLYRALGQSEDELDVDTDDLHLYAGSRLLLCSDGLTLHLKDKEIEQIMLSSSNPQTICQKLVDTANQRGGRDNISVIVVVAEADLDSVETYDDQVSEIDYEDDDPTVPIHRPLPFVDTPNPPPSPPESAYGEGNDIRKPMQ